MEATNLCLRQTSFERDLAADEMLELVPAPLAEDVAPGRVLVRLTARPVQPYDLNVIRQGLFLQKSIPVGCEGAGIVAKVGKGVTRVHVGQRVAPWLTQGFGSWQQYVDVPEENVFAVPPELTDEEASQMLLNPATLCGLLEELAVPSNEYLLQTAASSTLGRQLIQLAKHRGIKTINLVRRDDVKPELEALGADVVVNTTTEDVLARVKEVTGGNLAYASVDAVGGSLTKTVMACTRSNGDVLIYGVMDGLEAAVGILDLMRNVRVRWWSVSTYMKLSEEKSQNDMQEIVKLQGQGIMTHLVGKSFPLSQFREAMKESVKPGKGGKVILVG